MASDTQTLEKMQSDWLGRIEALPGFVPMATAPGT